MYRYKDNEKDLESYFLYIEKKIIFYLKKKKNNNF